MIALDGEFGSIGSMIDAIKAHQAQLATALEEEDQQALEAVLIPDEDLSFWLDAASAEDLRYVIVPISDTKTA